MTMHSHYDSGHSHGDPGGEAFATSTMLMIMALILAIVLIGAVFAWSPWMTTNTTNPGQGGSDEPAQQQQVPNTVPNTVPVDPNLAPSTDSVPQQIAPQTSPQR